MGKLSQSLRDVLNAAGLQLGDLAGTVLAVDPGPVTSYWAFFAGGRLVGTGKSASADQMHDFVGSPEVVLIETPVGWPVRSRDGGMALLRTAEAGGRLAGFFEARSDLTRVCMVPSAAWRSTLFGRVNPGDGAVKMYVEGQLAFDKKSNRKIQLNNAHVRDAAAVFLAARVALGGMV